MVCWPNACGKRPAASGSRPASTTGARAAGRTCPQRCRSSGASGSTASTSTWTPNCGHGPPRRRPDGRRRQHHRRSVRLGRVPGEFLRGLKPSLANLRVGVSVMPGTDVATRLTLVHMNHLSTTEVDLVAESGTRVVHCPAASLRRGMGAIRNGSFPEMLAKGRLPFGPASLRTTTQSAASPSSGTERIHTIDWNRARFQSIVIRSRLPGAIAAPISISIACCLPGASVIFTTGWRLYASRAGPVAAQTKSGRTPRRRHSRPDRRRGDIAAYPRTCFSCRCRIPFSLLPFGLHPQTFMFGLSLGFGPIR